jgi:hypothetical protein
LEKKKEMNFVDHFKKFCLEYESIDKLTNAKEDFYQLAHQGNEILERIGEKRCTDLLAFESEESVSSTLQVNSTV